MENTPCKYDEAPYHQENQSSRRNDNDIQFSRILGVSLGHVLPFLESPLAIFGVSLHSCPR